MDRRREDVRYLRDTAVRLLEIAAEMEEPATDRAGNDLGVSLAELAAEQAIRDFLAADPDNDDEDTADWPDIASTYRGRRA